MPNIKLLSSILKKLWPMLKLAQTDRPADQQTDRHTGQKQYVPHYILVDIKNITEAKLLSIRYDIVFIVYKFMRE